MAVVVEADHVERFLELADTENLEATVVAYVKEDPRLTMRWNGKNIVDISREFLNSNGAEKHIDVTVSAPRDFGKSLKGTFKEKYAAVASDLNVCSKRGLSERFDSTIGAGTVLMPFGGRLQLTPAQAMVHKISVEHADTDACSFMSWGYNPHIADKSPYHSAYFAVIESVAKLIASGADQNEVYLTFQEYFPKLGRDGRRWGLPMAALLGAFRAQKELGVAAIGGKDSMSGTFENLDVPPTLVSFAVTTGRIPSVVSPEFKHPGHNVILLRPEYGEDGLPKKESLLEVFSKASELISAGKVCAAYTPTFGGIAEAVMKMSFGNFIGFEFDEAFPEDDIFSYSYGSFILEMNSDENTGIVLGHTTDTPAVSYHGEIFDLTELLGIYENKLEDVYHCNIEMPEKVIPAYTFNTDDVIAPAIKVAKPKVLIPVFPGTNCEYDTAKAVNTAGGDAEIVVLNNLTPDGISRSVERFASLTKAAQMIIIPGGFSGGDEPDGSGKFITAFFRSAAVKDAVTELLDERDGLMCGICNGFQALIKLGLVPYGRIIDTDDTCPTLTYNSIGRHQSRLVRTRVATNKSPWLRETSVGEIFTVPISHGEGRFIASEELIAQLAANGQIATQYVDLEGNPTNDIHFNPNNSDAAIEGITSPDGRILGKMGHSERIGNGLYKNVIGKYDMGIFRSAVKYFN